MKKLIDTAFHSPITLIICIQSPYNPLKNFDAYVEEFQNLVTASGREFHHQVVIKLRHIEPVYYITKGKLHDIAELCEKEHVRHVIVSEPLSPSQNRNLEDLLGCEVIDRTLLILEIFERHAHSAEGKKQVALARFQYEKTRLSGKGIHYSQQEGRAGGRGPGETAKEKETQHLERTMHKLKKDLEHLARVRATQRKKRINRQIPLFCLIGYTNAGKSTILNGLTKSDVIAENKLFSTLDTTSRELYLGDHHKAIISDTVGFIQNLPAHLIEAFKSTLSELEHASLLIHVIDLSNPNWKDQIRVVHEVIEELGVETKPILYAFNKIDRLSEHEREELKPSLAQFIPHVCISANTIKGLAPLRKFLETMVHTS